MQPARNPSIGRFPILKTLAHGAQGAVYLSRDPQLDRPVAIKLVCDLPGQTVDEDQRWLQARNLAQLRHPNIIALYEVGRIHGFHYLVFEYLGGVPLRKELEGGRGLGLPLAYSTILQVADAMAYAHAKGILHLDLNPSNIMRDEAGKPRIMDFDLSRRVGAERPSEFISGTIPYMAIEQFSTLHLDAATDVYALGLIFYEMLTGQRVVPPGSNEQMIEYICREEIDYEPLRKVDPESHFSNVIRKATTKEIAERYPHARAMHEALVCAWEKVCHRIDAGDAVIHGTVAFVLKRIERRGEFPVVSKTLAEICQLTGGASQQPISRLANVVLRDYAMTSRLLKIANSAYYKRGAGKISTVSEAINVLGIDQVHMVCTGLACFRQFAGQKNDVGLREGSTGAFIAGLASRHLATLVNPKESEEAFLAGMLFHLGRMLVLFYFSEDYQEIDDLARRGATMDEAARSVLGIGFSELGYAVGKTWGLPPVVLNCMLESPPETPNASSEALRSIVRFANRLTSVDPEQDPTGAGIDNFVLELPPKLRLGPQQAHALLDAAIEKFKVFAPALEVDVSQSNSLRRLDQWLKLARERLQVNPTPS